MTPFLDSVVRFVLAMLFDGLWEAALLAVAAWIALRTLPNANATTRHTLLAAALLASLVMPVITAAITTIEWRAPVTAAISQVRHAHRLPRPIERLAHTPAMPAFERAVVRPNVTIPRVLAIVLVAAWLLGALFVLARLILSLLHLERLKRDALPVPVEYRAQLERWTTANKGARTVRLCRSGEIVIPLAVGLFDAMILVPEHLLEDLEPKEIDQIVLHELAHLRRGDDWLNAVERFAQALLFFNPGVQWLVAHLDLEREVACDDWVLQQNQALPYATCLAKIVETTMWPHRAMSAPGAFVTRRAMSVRIERLLSKHRDVRVRASIGPTGIVVAALVALCVAAAFVSPSFAYSIGATPQVVASRPPIAAPKSIAASNPSGTKPPSTEQLVPKTPAILATPANFQTQIVVSERYRTTVSSTVAAKTIAAAIASAKPASTVAISATTSPAPLNTPAYIDQLASTGYTGLTVDELVRLRAVGVTADFIRELAANGVVHPSVEELVRLKSMGCSPKYIGEMRSRFGATTTMDQITSLMAVGVTTDYLDAMAAQGVRNLTVDQARTLKAVGVTPAFVANANAHGFHNLTVEQLVRLKTMGVLQ